MQETLKPVDKVEIITLADNYIDLVSVDNSDVITRAAPLRGMEFSNSILAEHGFSCLIRVTCGEKSRTMILDFGLSEDSAVRNAEALSLDLTAVEAAALSHGHVDHFGGMARVGEKVGKKGLELLTHPGVFKKKRYFEPFPDFKVILPVVTRQKIKDAGFALIESEDPCPMLDGHMLFLGNIPRVTEFETGTPSLLYETEDGTIQHDPLDDDTALVVMVKGKGLVVVSGCAHSGIINTVQYAKKLTGENQVHAVMGGFHLGGPVFEPIIGATISALKQIAPEFVIPAHCTGRNAVLEFEKAFPENFILNMSGTTLTFQ